MKRPACSSCVRSSSGAHRLGLLFAVPSAPLLGLWGGLFDMDPPRFKSASRKAEDVSLSSCLESPPEAACCCR